MVYLRTICGIAFILLSILNCSEKLDHSDVIGKVGQQKIIFDEFYESFHLYPKYRQNSTLRQARLQQIDYMVDRIYLKMAAEKEGLDQFQDVKERIDYNFSCDFYE